MQKVSKFLYSSIDLHMCTLDSPTDVRTVLRLSAGVLQRHWCRYSLTQLIHVLHLPLVHKSFLYSHGYKSKGIKSGDLGGHAFDPPLPIRLPGKC
jgi:hypothetical protein